MPRIHLVHPKFINDAWLVSEHDFLHRLLDSLSEGKEVLDHPDAFRFNGRRGQLYIRHRKLAEELCLRGMDHTTYLDRRIIEADEWGAPEREPEDLMREVQEHRGAPEGRLPLPEGGDEKDYTCPEDICSVVVGIVEEDILLALWKIYRFMVMERSYSRYRSLADPLQGRMRGSVWMLFDLMMEEALGSAWEDRGPAIAYETMWERLQEGATPEEKAEYLRLEGALVPGRPGLEMRAFLASVATRQDDKDLQYSALLTPYL